MVVRVAPCPGVRCLAHAPIAGSRTNRLSAPELSPLGLETEQRTPTLRLSSPQNPPGCSMIGTATYSLRSRGRSPGASIPPTHERKRTLYISRRRRGRSKQTAEDHTGSYRDYLRRHCRESANASRGRETVLQPGGTRSRRHPYQPEADPGLSAGIGGQSRCYSFSRPPPGSQVSARLLTTSHHSDFEPEKRPFFPGFVRNSVSWPTVYGETRPWLQVCTRPLAPSPSR
jgi:hypothetical protein